MNTSTQDSNPNPNNPIIHDIPPYLRVYKDGTIERLLATETTPPSLDPLTKVESKDVIFEPKKGLKARIYRPTNLTTQNKKLEKLPLIIYYHGGAFLIASMAEPKYHNSLNLLVKESKAIAVSVDYRLAPENPLPAAYEDSWAALEWVGSHESGRGEDPWINELADFSRVFLAGDSAGANISYHMALRMGPPKTHAPAAAVHLKVAGMVMIHPYFWGEEPIGFEAENELFKSVVDRWWLFVCPSEKGCDDPWINPFVVGAPGPENLGCRRVLVCVAGGDVLRERGKLFYENLMAVKETIKSEFFESEGEDHVFHLFNPTSNNSIKLIERCAEFLNS